MKNLLLLLISISSFSKIYAQDFSYNKIQIADFDSKNIKANAVVLREFGKARIEYNEVKGELVLRNYYHTKILILNKEGFKNADFAIELYKDTKDREFIEGIKGTTYNLVDGKITETNLEKNKILTEKSSENLSLTKIAFPDLKEGSIIELRYSVESPFLYNLQTWDFESDIPKLHSEFITEIPVICEYNLNLKGGKSLTSHNTESYDTKITTSTGEVNGVRTIYIMKDMPAFVEEDYMTASHNFTSRLSFELARFSIPFGPSHNYTQTWENVEKTLSSSEYFGKELKRKSVFKEIIPTVTTAEMSDLEKATAIYEYVRKNIKWNKKNSLFTDNGVKKALELKNGNVADINIALICALEAAGFEVNPIILSTRANGYPSFIHPALSDFNYVIANLKIGEEVYLLDASDSNTPFGLIPLRCINFQGRNITSQGSDWIDLKASMSSKIAYTYTGTLEEDGSSNGELKINYFGYAGNNKREEIKNYNSLEEYFEDYSEKTTQFAVLDNKIDYLDNTNFSLAEDYKIKINNLATVNNNKITFNPFFVGRTVKNPFNLDERSYPVDLGSKIETSYEISLKIPEGFKLSEGFKNINMSLPNRDARYFYAVNENDGILTIQVLNTINKPLFLPEEYLDLKEFFSRIIQSQKIDLSLEKI